VKRIFIVVFLVLTIGLFADGLNSNALLLKNNIPDTYQAIKNRAVGEWGDDHTMVVYVINKQSDALFEVLELTEVDEEIVIYAIYEWCDDKVRLEANPDDMFIIPIDWEMAAYTAKKQISAKAAY